ncbi:YhbD family protein [Faecalimicrobium sp. JNUCC 81]
MEKNLISKKELLEVTNISYGQLYRWKRKNIIPEEWFIKKSTFTGQETFLPKEKVLERIEYILSMKDDISLDDMANMFAKKESDKKFDIESLVSKNVVCENTKNIFEQVYKTDEVGKKELLILNIIESYLIKSIITIEELKQIISIIDSSFDKLYDEDATIYLFRKLGVPFAVGCKSYKDVFFDENMVKIIDINLVKEISEIAKKMV